jgi:tetratricopeptide (TPR) repeat protein
MQEYLELAAKESTAKEQDPRVVICLEQIIVGRLNYVFDQALQYTRKLISIRGSAKDWSLQAFILGESKQFEEALTNSNYALSIESDNDLCWSINAWCLHKLGRYEESINSYDQVINLKPDCPEAWNSRGISFFNLGRYNDAIHNIEKALEINPNALLYVANKAEILLASNHWSEGTAVMKDILNRLQQSNETYPSALKLVIKDLFIQDPSQWQSRIADLISWFEPFPTAVTKGLVSACKKLISPLISDTTATLWHDTWHELTHHLPEYQLPLRLLTTALHYKQKPDDPRVWMELSIEERKILQQALGIDSIESRD